MTSAALCGWSGYWLTRRFSANTTARPDRVQQLLYSFDLVAQCVVLKGTVREMAYQQPQTHLSAELVQPADDRRRTASQGPTTPTNSLLNQIIREGLKGHYEQAVTLSRKSGASDLDVINARGVCLMRLGKYREAVVLFRNLVLQPGCVGMRYDRPAHYKTNYATALLLGGHVGGCLDVICELGDQAPQRTALLRNAIQRWVATLPFWTWCNWKVYGVEPLTYPVTLDFDAGEFTMSEGTLGETSCPS